MIRITVTRVEDDGAETDMGEVRLVEAGADVYSHLSTSEGGGVMTDLLERLRANAPRPLRPLAKSKPACTCGIVRRLGKPARIALNPDCLRHGLRSLQ